jgi:hypothetical protein
VIVRFHLDDEAITLQTNASMRCRSLTTAKHATHVGSLLGEGDACQRDISPRSKCHTPGPIAKKRLPARCSYNRPDLSGG